jgi:drug/metabolite transporter (DMT)-like permease
MQPLADQTRSLVTLDTKVALLGLGTAALTATGIFFQKLNAVRMGNPLLSGWLLLAILAFFPTFIIANKVFLMGGRMSLFVPATAATYVLSIVAGHFYFREQVSLAMWLGCALIVAGVVVVAQG